MTLIGLFVLAMAAGATGEGAVQDQTAPAAEAFLQACADRQLKLDRIKVEPVPASELPEGVKGFFYQYAEGDTYRLTGALDGFLIVGRRYREPSLSYSSLCAIAAPGVSPIRSSQLVYRALGDSPPQPRPDLTSRTGWSSKDNVPVVRSIRKAEGFEYQARFLTPTFFGKPTRPVGPEVIGWTSLEIRTLKPASAKSGATQQ